MKNMRIYDITRSINEKMTLWPGDEPVEIKHLKSIEENGYTYSRISIGAHTGTHIDAPWHFIDGGRKINDMELGMFIGPCRVIEHTGSSNIMEEEIAGHDVEEGEIILFKTDNSRFDNSPGFRKDYTAVDISAAKYMVRKRVKAMGIDYFSIDPYDSRYFDVHKVILGNGIGVIEGLNLMAVPPGKYFFSGLPLKIDDAEASPIRAVLISGEEIFRYMGGRR